MSGFGILRIALSNHDSALEIERKRTGAHALARCATAIADPLARKELERFPGILRLRTEVRSGEYQQQESHMSIVRLKMYG